MRGLVERNPGERVPEAERRPSERLAETELPCQLRSLNEWSLRGLELARTGLRLAEGDQELAASRFVGRHPPEHVESLLEMAGGFLVAVHRRRPPAGPDRVVDRLLRVA